MKLLQSFLLLALLSLATTVAAEDSCLGLMQKIFETKWNKKMTASVQSSLAKKSTWATTSENGFTQINPTQKDQIISDNFRFLVRMINTFNGGGEEGDKNFLRQLSSMQADFTPPFDARVYSASVIDQNHKATFGRIGYILETDGDAVVASEPRDIGTWKLQKEWGFGEVNNRQRQDEFAAALLENRGIETPEELLKKPYYGQMPWSEVLLYLHPEFKSHLKIKALVYMGYEGMNQEQLIPYKQHAESIGIPFVLIMR